MADPIDPLKFWRDALQAGQQSVFNGLAAGGHAGAVPNLADWWSRLGGASSAQDPASQYLAACDHFFNMTRRVFEQAQTAGGAAQNDPQRFAQEFAGALGRWFTESGAKSSAPMQAWLELSALGANREQQLAWRRIGELTQQFQQLQSQLAQLWSAVGNQAAQRFGEQIAAAREHGQSFDSLKALYDGWIEQAEQAYASQAHQANYASVLAQLTNTLSALRAEQAQLAAAWAKNLDLPTRAEIDSLRARIDQLQTEIAAQRAAPKPAPKRRPPRGATPEGPAS